MSRLTPYDSGEILEPVLWCKPVNGAWVAGAELPRRPGPDDWGKVDFENDESAAQFAIRVVWFSGAPGAPAGWRVEIDRLNDMEILSVSVDGEEVHRAEAG